MNEKNSLVSSTKYFSEHLNWQTKIKINIPDLKTFKSIWKCVSEVSCGFLGSYEIVTNSASYEL